MIKTVSVTPFYNMMSYLLSRHLMFGIHSLQELKIFIEGYSFAINTNNLEDIDLTHFGGFDEFLKKKFKDNSTQGWVSTIRNNCRRGTNELEYFSQLLNDYKKELVR